MKILYLCTYYHRATIFRNSMDGLKNFGHDVKAFNAVVKDSNIDDKYKDIMDDEVIHCECFKNWNKYFYILKQKKFYNALIQSYNLREFDFIHSHNLFNGGYAARYAHLKYGIPYVVSVRNTDINTFLKIPFYKHYANKIIKDAAAVQFLSKPYRDEFISKYVYKNLKREIINKSICITNGIEEFWLNNKSEAKTLHDHSTINLLCIGKIDKNKNMLTILKVLDVLKSKNYDVKFTVVGQIVNKDVYNILKNSKETTIINYLSKEELIKVYRKNDIYLMPSIHETFGRVYAEAMTQGLPVIYSKGQGFDGIFEDGKVGFSVPSKNVNYIADCIEKIMQNYFDISRNCIEESKQFDWKFITRQLSDFYITI